MSLLYDLAQFDGKSTAVLQDIFQAHNPPSDGALDVLVDVLGDDDAHMQIGASWLLRAYLADGFRLTDTQVGRLASNLPGMHDGFGRLHICQAIRDLSVPSNQADVFADFMRASAASKNTFLRAWAPDGFFRLAEQHDRFMDEAKVMVVAALSDPAPSVRARARKTLAED